MERRNKTHRCRNDVSSQLYDMEGHIESNYSVISVKTKGEKNKNKTHRYVGKKKKKTPTFYRGQSLTWEVVPCIT